MVGAWHEVLGNMANESFFSFEGSFAVVGKSDAVGYTKYVSIYCHGWLTKADGCDDIGSFATYTRQGGEFFGSTLDFTPSKVFLQGFNGNNCTLLIHAQNLACILR